MKRFVLLAYLVFLVMFTVNMMNRPDPEDVVVPDLAFDIVGKSKMTLPKTPIFRVTNNTENTVSIDNCEHIEIRDSGSLRSLPEDLCEIFEIEPASSEPVLGHREKDVEVFQKRGDIQLDLEFAYQEDGIDIKTQKSVQINNPGGFKTFFRTIFYRPVYNFFVFLIETTPGKSLGIAIITITIIIRLILLHPQQKIMVSQQKMQTIQPKVAAIQKKYKNDQAQLGMKIMELYKKEGVNPFGSFVPLFIQIPILIVLYWTILGINDISNHYHLYDFSILQDFRDTEINEMFFGVHLLESGGMVGIGLAIIVGLAQFVQMKLSQKRNEKKNPPKKEEKKKKNPDEPEMPDMQQVGKMMVYFLPIMVAFFTYQFPAGVGLYWLVGTLFMIVQQYFVNASMEKKKDKPQILDASGKEINT